MHTIAELSVIPVGTAPSLSVYLANCKQVFEDSGLEHEMHANGTNIEGEWDTIADALKKCHEVLHGLGVPRITTTVKLETRVDTEQTLSDRVESVEEKRET